MKNTIANINPLKEVRLTNEESIILDKQSKINLFYKIFVFIGFYCTFYCTVLLDASRDAPPHAHVNMTHARLSSSNTSPRRITVL